MPVTERTQITRPACRANEWISAACEQFSRATGWPLRFVAARRRGERPERHDLGSECWWVEVRDGQKIVGRLSLGLPDGETGDHSFAAVRELAELVADLLGKNFDALRMLDSRTHELSTLVELGSSAPKEDELLGTLKQLLRASLQLTGFQSACFLLLDPRTDELRLRVAHHVAPRDVPRPVRSLRENPPDLEALMEGGYALSWVDSFGQAGWLPRDVSSGLCLPVQTGSGPLGTLWLFDRRLRQLNECEQHVLESLCSQMALILERVVVRQDRTTQRRIQQDLQCLADARRGQTPVQTLRHHGLQVAWRSSSRFEVGGDLCESLSLSDHELAVMIGDATGDGFSAAMTMTA
ncbi:MAG TPA: GAF domain-containing protein, partial [Planctomycetaceae bacterium]|nr:GAF domain-containing protein [Planctomycetaceae bacterium]